MIAVLQYKNTDNPLGLPGDYPAQTYPLKEGESVKPPWVEMSEEELKVITYPLLQKVSDIFNARAESEKASSESKVSSLESAFNQIQSIKDKVEGAGGKLDAADQTALLLYTLETLLLLREPLMQIQKRSL